MDVNTVLGIVKARLGISTAVRDTYLTAIINGVIKELMDEKGVVLDPLNDNHVLFVADYSTWRYQSRDSAGDMPKDIRFRLNNLYVHDGSPVVP